MKSSFLASPTHITDQELEGMKDFLVEGGEIQQKGLMIRIKKAHLVAIVRIGGSIAAMGAIKNPDLNYRDGAAKESSFPDLRNYGRELGWIRVHPRLEGIGLGRLVTRLLVRDYPDPLWATTKVSNFAMHHILCEEKFMRAGKSYPSDRRQTEILVWIREAATSK